MPFGELNLGKKIEKTQSPPPKEIKDKKTDKEKALEALTRKIYNLMKEVSRKELQEKGKENFELLREKSSEKEEKYPVSELRESAGKYGFDEVLINEEVPQIASAFPDKIIFFPEKCFLPLRKIKEFAPEFAKKGIDSVFSYQSQFLKGGALEMGKKLYNEMDEYFLITKTIEAMPKVQADLRVKGIFLDRKVIEKIIREERERQTKMDESMKRLQNERETKVGEQDRASAESEEEAVKKIANYTVFLELLYDDSHNIESNLRKESLTLLSSSPKEKEKFGEKVILESKKIKSELRKKYEESKTGSMYG